MAANAQDRWNYNDVDLRIAERRVIPHYRRHSVEYPDIDIKAIMQQRGIVPRPIPNRPIQTVNNNFRKSVAISNHLEPHHGYYKKRNKYSKYSKYSGKHKKQRWINNWNSNGTYKYLYNIACFAQMRCENSRGFPGIKWNISDNLYFVL